MPSASAGASGLATRYATALFELAEEAGALDRASEDLARVGAAIEESEDLRSVIESPVLSRDEQGRAIAAVSSHLGAHDLTTRFLGVLAAQRRLFALPGAIAAFQAMLAKSRGEIEAEVVSARALTPEQLDGLRAKVSSYAGKAVNLEARVDPSLMGGLVVRVGSRMIDASIKSKLHRLENAMRGLG